VLRQIHDDLDAAVADAYGWPRDLSDEEILQRLVELNQERAAEERRGIVRWLRPDFQCPGGTPAAQPELALAQTDAADEADTAPKTTPAKKQPWPKPLPERVRAIRAALLQAPGPLAAADLARQFTRARQADVAELLETLAAIGQARVTEDGRYVA
jgi:hypothetical protein